MFTVSPGHLCLAPLRSSKSEAGRLLAYQSHRPGFYLVAEQGLATEPRLASKLLVLLIKLPKGSCVGIHVHAQLLDPRLRGVRLARDTQFVSGLTLLPRT